jgi:carboxypeptidase Taq
MSEKLERLKTLLAEVTDLEKVKSLLSWDQQTYMPPGGAEARGNQLATLSSISHQKFTVDEIGTLLDDLEKEFKGSDPESDEVRFLEVVRHKYDRERLVPSDFVSEQAIVASKAYEAWVKARENSDFSIFLPHLEKIVALKQRYVSFFPPSDHPYDVLLDGFERGMKTAEVMAIFNSLRPQQVELVHAISEKPEIEDSFLNLEYDNGKMWGFSEEIATKFGYDWDRGRQDLAPHPFTTDFSINDVRITNRFEPETPPNLLFSAMHEVGHALYELGINQEYERTPLAGGASLSIHESQSRMWENLVGRSLPFWEHFYPRFQELFPAQVGNLDVQTFYKGINKVEPSLIRVDADEATYNLHIMLRLELEIAMLEGTAELKDLPEIWNAKMQEYLGITPPNDRLGVLQDVHWSYGDMGYFSTYALGNLVSAQLWEKITGDIPNLEDQFRMGEFGMLLDWLRKKIHVHGKKFKPQELVEMVTGSKIDPAPYVRYLKKKFGVIYGL